LETKLLLATVTDTMVTLTRIFPIKL